jgi:hypothetical protein
MNNKLGGVAKGDSQEDLSKKMVQGKSSPVSFVANQVTLHKTAGRKNTTINR